MKTELAATVCARDELRSHVEDRDREIGELRATIEELKNNHRELDGPHEPQHAAVANGDGPDPDTGVNAGGGSGRVARLLVQLQGGRTLKHPLYKEAMVIGRGADTDIQVNGRYSSRRHARIFVNDDEIYIEDLGSTNGISVNAQAVQRQRLHDGDIVDVGGAQLRFVDPTERATAGSGPEPN
jgi:hypothetical protein